PPQLAVFRFAAAAGIRRPQIRRRGSAPALSDLLGGQIPLIWSTPIAVMPFVEQGKVKARGVSTEQRVAILPQVPPIAENALPGFHIDAWLGVAAPANTPPEVVTRLGGAIRAITALSEVEQRMSPLGFRLDYRPAQEIREPHASEHQCYRDVIRAAGIVPN